MPYIKISDIKTKKSVPSEDHNSVVVIIFQSDTVY